MLTNKKCMKLGTTIISALVLTSLSGQTVEAATTSTSTSSTTTPTTATITVSPTVTTSVTAPVTSSTTSTTTAPVTTTSTTSTTSTGTTATTAPTTSTTSTGTTAATTPATSTTSTSTTGTATPTTSTASTTGTTSPTTSTTGGTTTAPSTSTGTTTAPTTSSTSSTTGSTTGSTTTATTGTSTTSSSSSGSTAGATLPASSLPVSVPTTLPGGQTNIVADTGGYKLPTNLTDSTVVNFSDSTLAGMVRQALGLSSTAPITVGDIKTYQPLTVTLTLDEGQYLAKTTGTSYVAQADYVPIESLDGMQYLQLLPHDTISFTGRLGSDANANPSLEPMYGIKLNQLQLIGNYSDPSKKEINVSQITKLETPIGSAYLAGDDGFNGITNDELKTLAPWVVQFSNNSTYGSLVMNGNTISDFSPLGGINRNTHFSLNTTGGVYDPTTVYGVVGQPMQFTSTPVKGLDGEDVASNYGFTLNTASPAYGNLTAKGNDTYVIQDPTGSYNKLVYGDSGFDPKYNPTYNLGGVLVKQYGTTQWINNMIHAQPVVWQTSPTVQIKYVDSNGSPIMNNGVAMTKTVDGTTIGSSFDLTPDSTVAGYTLTSPATTLKGTYTQDPQEITLTYKAIPTSTYSGSNYSTPQVTTPKTPVNVEPVSRIPIKIYSLEGKETGENALLADMGVKATTTINGQEFYQVGYGQWVAASSFNTVKTSQPGTVRTFNSTVDLVDSSGKEIGRVVSPSSGWKYSKIVTISGDDYYQVATDEFVPVASGIPYTSVPETTSVGITSSTPIYNSQGESIGTTLPANTSWRTDSYATINGEKMYRVATDEWVPASSLTTYQPISSTYTAKGEIPLYDHNGKLLGRTLAPGTSWKTDQLATINGREYYRVATNEYVLA